MYSTAVLVFNGRLNIYATFLTERLLDKSFFFFFKHVLPRTRIDLYKMNFAFSGSSVWNSLPPKTKTYKSVRGFKAGLRKNPD